MWEHLNRNVKDKRGERVKNYFRIVTVVGFISSPSERESSLLTYREITSQIIIFFKFSLSLQISVLLCFYTSYIVGFSIPECWLID